MSRTGKSSRFDRACAVVIGQVLGKEAHGNVSEACRRLGISRDKYYRLTQNAELQTIVERVSRKYLGRSGDADTEEHDSGE